VIAQAMLAALVAAVGAGVGLVLDLPVVRRRPVATVVLAAAIGGLLGWSAASLTPSLVVAAGWGLVGAGLATQTVIDLATRTLPRQISYATLVLATPLLLAGPATVGDRALGMAVGAVGMTAVTLVLALAARGALGIGDVHLAPLLGAAVGWVDPWAVVTAWLVTALVGGLTVVGLLVARRVDRRGLVPYGPFMVTGTVVAVVLASFGAAAG
jgi:leader peptidase (prepilin peptidase) / N-methyltransferase